MVTKKFSLLIVLFYFSALFILLMIMVFTNKKFSPNWKKGEITGSEIIFREYKSKYIGQKNLKYNAYILGGSKAGFLRPEIFNKFTNYNFYNYWTSIGLFGNYEPFCKYIIESQSDSIEEIVLHLSTYETAIFYDKVYIPIAIQNSLLGKCSSGIKFFKEKYLNISYFLSLINFHKTRKASIKNDGDINIAEEALASFNNDCEKYINHYVLNCFDKRIKEMFSSKINQDLCFCKFNIKSLERMKKLCDEHNVKLTVVIGAHFISKMGDIYNEDFNNYLRDLISVSGFIWNFSGINNENMNPYNFYDEGHFWNFTGDKMIEKMYSPNPNSSNFEEFGILLTKDNIEQYIESQKQKWLKLKTEYEALGTIKLYNKDDSSYLGSSILISE